MSPPCSHKAFPHDILVGGIKCPCLVGIWLIPFLKVSSSYHLYVKCFSQLSFDSEVHTKSATAADFVYTSESNESCEKHSTQR